MTGRGPESGVLDQIEGGSTSPLFVVAGELVVAEGAAQRIAASLAQPLGVEVVTHRRPADLREILADLRTFSLFEAAKVVLAIDSSVLSDRSAAAYLIDQVAEVLPIAESDELAPRERLAAGRLLQVLHLFDAQVGSASAAETLAQLPDWVFQGGVAPGKKAGRKKRRGKKQAESLVEQLVALLEAAWKEDLQGWAETDAADLGAVLREGLPDGHFLVLCEASVAKDHPVVEAVRSAGSLVEVGSVEADRRGNWTGVDSIVEELSRETGCSIDANAVSELVRRTLKQQQGWGNQSARADTTARFAAEFRKLSALAPEGRISRSLVVEVVKDRGEEDIFKILDAIGSGRSDEALSRLRRMLESAEDPMAVRLGFFSQLATFCRHLAAISGMIQASGLPAGERNYNRFKSGLASKLQAPVPGTEVAPLSGLHPYRLHRAYLAAGRFSAPKLRTLLADVLDVEMQLKGESANPDAALTLLVSRLSAAAL